jgi:hypothetical protein
MPIAIAILAPKLSIGSKRTQLDWVNLDGMGDEDDRSGKKLTRSRRLPSKIKDLWQCLHI